VGAALLADATEVDAAGNGSTTSKATIALTTYPTDSHSMDDSMETTTLVAKMGMVAEMAVALD
jgi:hypothetical protein